MSHGGSGINVNGIAGASILGGGRAFSGCGSRFAHDGSPGAFVTAAATVGCGFLDSAHFVPFPLCIGFGARRVQFPFLWVRRRLYSKTNGPLVQ